MTGCSGDRGDKILSFYLSHWGLIRKHSMERICVSFAESTNCQQTGNMMISSIRSVMSHLYCSPWLQVAMKEEMFLRMPPPFSTTAVDLLLRSWTRKPRAPSRLHTSDLFFLQWAERFQRAESITWTSQLKYWNIFRSESNSRISRRWSLSQLVSQTFQYHSRHRNDIIKN